MHDAKDGEDVQIPFCLDESMTTDQQRMRLAWLEREIAEYPYWGAALTAMDEERSGLQRSLADDEDRRFGQPHYGHGEDDV